MIHRELCKYLGTLKYIVHRNVLHRQSKCRHLSCDPCLKAFALRNYAGFFSCHRNGIKITTPEEIILVCAPSAVDKVRDNIKK